MIVLLWAVTRVTVLGVCAREHTQCEMRCEQAGRWVGLVQLRPTQSAFRQGVLWDTYGTPGKASVSMVW